MNIYKLTPINTDANDWRASTYKNEVAVQAKNETNARFIAQSAFGIAVAISPGQPIAMMPWPRTDRATCVLVGSNDDIEERIIKPENHNAR